MIGRQGIETVCDDIYSKTGTRNGNAYISEITTPLVHSLSCNLISSGVILITPSVHSPITVDLGNATCNEQTRITSNGNSHKFLIP